MSNNANDYQDELDVYQAAWVLGKQRGQVAPLKKEQLERLLEAGRLEWEWLGEEEKKLLGNGEDKGKSSEVARRANKMLIARLIVGGLVRMVEREHADFFRKLGERKVSEEVREAFREELFRFKYGSYPEYLSFKIANGVV